MIEIEHTDDENRRLRSLSRRFKGESEIAIKEEAQRLFPNWDDDNLDVVADNLSKGVMLGMDSAHAED